MLERLTTIFYPWLIGQPISVRELAAPGRSARSSRSGEATRAVRGATPFRSAGFARFVQAAPHTVGVEVLGVDRRTGLLPPGLVQTAGIDAIKAQFVDKLQNDGLGRAVIARKAMRPGAPAGRPNSRRCRA